MASILQIQANRRNSQKSTGPRTAAGKAVSSMNALKSGIDAKSQVIRGEDEKDLEALKANYYDSLQPTRPEEAALVDMVIAADWLLRRLRKAEAETWNDAFEKQENYEQFKDKPEQTYRLATALQDRGDTFARLQRRLDAAERSLHCSLAGLRRLQESHPDIDPPAQPQPGRRPLTPGPQPLTIGFVPSPNPQPLTPSPQTTAPKEFPEPAESLNAWTPSRGPQLLSAPWPSSMI
jgi:hypothetical protein